MKNISKESYKGVRDFYPEDMQFLRNLYKTCEKVANSYGYVEYGASPLEPSELFHAKSGEEIINEQTYTFEDRGGRQVTLRPEMTPTLARMVAARKRNLAFPLRWFSFPNLFRYEQPQRGRLREHYQLNVDLFGLKNIEAEIEVISLGAKILMQYGATIHDFKIYINNRKLYSEIINNLNLNHKSHELSKLLDKKSKLSKEDFERKLHQIADEKSDVLVSLLNANDLESFVRLLPEEIGSSHAFSLIEEIILGLSSIGLRNVEFKFDLMRGFDYYTGIVFEFFDVNKDNNRSLFGGGRYDELLSIFDEEPIPAVGFGMGDVTIRDFLETHNLLPKYRSPIDLTILTLPGVSPDFINNFALDLRNAGVNLAVDWSDKKIGDKIKNADKSGSLFIVCIGSEEESSLLFKIKNVTSGEEITERKEKLADFLIKSRNE